jgi:hypothetical protein
MRFMDIPSNGLSYLLQRTHIVMDRMEEARREQENG